MNLWTWFQERRRQQEDARMEERDVCQSESAPVPEIFRDPEEYALWREQWRILDPIDERLRAYRERAERQGRLPKRDHG